MLVGPSVSGILFTGLVHGRAGFRNLFIRMRRWRVGARWYAVALLTAPLVFTAVLVPLSLISQVFRLGMFASDAKVSFVLMNIVVALVIGILEELGWTGFAVPTLLGLRYGALHRSHRGGALGSVAPPWERYLGKRRYCWRSPPALFVVLRGLSLLVGNCWP